MADIAKSRLAEERKQWRKSKPFGFVGKPETDSDGAVNLMKWNCRIPGKAGTPWEGGLYPLDLIFNEDYPRKTPKAKFPDGFFHPNVYPDGLVCISILNDDPDFDGAWAPSLSISQILLGIQELLNDPNLNSPAQDTAYTIMKNKPAQYNKRVITQARKYPSADDTA